MADKKKFIPILRTVLIVIFLFYLITLFGVIKSKFIKEHIDFPCDAEVTSDGCLNYLKSKDDNRKDKKLEVFITVFFAGVHGATCEHISTSSSKLRVLGYKIEVDGETLTINNKITLTKGNTWHRERVSAFLNPWRITKRFIKIKNYGTVNRMFDMKTGISYPYGPTVIALGRGGTFYKTNWNGIFTLIILIVIFVLTFVFKKKEKPEKFIEPEELEKLK
ncbi:hypothetical protein KAU33_03635 [Candidatus Dependentiae bacterium]|nr:hypothetical protein [Candidatus Dependentiae bacterium]